MLKTFTKDNTWFTSKVPNPLDYGWGNGYVIIPKDHPAFGKSYDDLYDIDVHGGLTYSQELTKERCKAFGIDESNIGSWVVGFDTFHYGDDIETCSEQFVKSEVDNLRKQLEEYSSE